MYGLGTCKVVVTTRRHDRGKSNLHQGSMVFTKVNVRIEPPVCVIVHCNPRRMIGRHEN